MALAQKRQFNEAHPRLGWAVAARGVGTLVGMGALAALGARLGEHLWPLEGTAFAWVVGGSAAALLVAELWKLGRQLGGDDRGD